MPIKVSRFSLVLLGALLIITALMVWSARGQHFSQSPEEVRDALLSAKIDTGWLGQDSHLDISETSDNVVTTRFKNQRGETSLMIASEINPSFDGTQVRSDFLMNKDALSKEDAIALDKADDGLVERYTAEYIASNIEGRRFDITALIHGFGAMKLIGQLASASDDRAQRSLEPSFPPISNELSPDYHSGQSADGFSDDAEIEYERLRQEHQFDQSSNSLTHGSSSSDWGAD